jgi:hypothetical protein
MYLLKVFSRDHEFMTWCECKNTNLAECRRFGSITFDVVQVNDDIVGSASQLFCLFVNANPAVPYDCCYDVRF